MIVHDVKQGSAAWLKLRMGRPTSSNFHRIVTPTGKLSESRATYLDELAAELVMGRPLENVTTPMMNRGSFLEADARASYEFQNDVEVQQVGFCTNDEGTYGSSTDGLIGDDGILELKTPTPENHIRYLLWGRHAAKYKPQCQGSLLVTNREWLDIVSFNPEMPLAIVRVVRDEPFIKLLQEQLHLFTDELNLIKIMLEERGYLHHDAPPPKEFLTDADVDAIVTARREQGGFDSHAQ